MTDYPIVRLQVQRDPIRVGHAPRREYDPAQLISVRSIDVGPRGVHGRTADGELVLDVHHQDHPRCRDPKGTAGVLVMGTGDYVALRDRYGRHMIDGIAGETVLVDAPDGLRGRGLPAVVTVLTTGGPVELHQVRTADPCVEFSRYCLRQPVSDVVDDDVRQTLIALRGGARGYRSVAASTGSFMLGDLLRA